MFEHHARIHVLMSCANVKSCNIIQRQPNLTQSYPNEEIYTCSSKAGYRFVLGKGPTYSGEWGGGGGGVDNSLPERISKVSKVK